VRTRARSGRPADRSGAARKGVSPVIGVDESRLRHAAGESLGLTVLDGAADPRDAAGDEIGYAFESSGAPALVEWAIEAVRPRGVVVFAALYGGPVPVDVGLVARKELVLRGSATVAPGDFREAIGLLASGAVRMQPLITHRRRLDQIDDAFELQRDTEKSVQVLISSEA
jgi:threonine dehydrogenase-like Zn-dependent dehydrogenase